MNFATFEQPNFSPAQMVNPEEELDFKKHITSLKTFLGLEEDVSQMEFNSIDYWGPGEIFKRWQIHKLHLAQEISMQGCCLMQANVLMLDLGCCSPVFNYMALESFMGFRLLVATGKDACILIRGCFSYWNIFVDAPGATLFEMFKWCFILRDWFKSRHGVEAILCF
ncbi:hypothetical protein POM88_054606 [Heracleum sosnowskyi]|uniref:Uncharacterized protein n=1 Tax=Heracleum sosnowskyi TaxID=360622 RepID=A0AAD8GM14_9APIA|nr:hypothetical protein POM88_054599 [Heracleum sosnowskyi]KAK1350685.1 hypothetical protein POM88_054606 [Heracleum sosnowskyi]